MGAPKMRNHSGAPPVKPNVFQKLFRRRGKPKKAILQVASALPDSAKNSNNTKKNHNWRSSTPTSHVESIDPIEETTNPHLSKQASSSCFDAVAPDDETTPAAAATTEELLALSIHETDQPILLSNSMQKRLIKERDGFCRRVNRYDGSVIHVEGIASYELGNYLGGGVAGVVYEGQRLLPERAYPVRRSKEEPTPAIETVQNPHATNPTTTTTLMDYVVPSSVFCHPSAAPDETTSAPIVAPTDVINIPTADDSIPREGSLLTTESFAHGGGARSVAGNSVALEATEDSILVDDQDAPSRSIHMAESLTKHCDDNNFMEEKVAIKILNPVGFRALSSDITKHAVVARPGVPLSAAITSGRAPMEERHVWWLVNPSSRNLRTLQKYTDDSTTPRGVEVDRGSADRGLRISLIAAYECNNVLKELPLNRCIEIWGHVPFETSDADFKRMMQNIDRIHQGLPPSALPPDRVATATSSTTEGTASVSRQQKPPSPMASKRTGILKAASTPRKTVYCAELNAYIAIPSVPSKFLKWLRQRRAATKEIRNMMLIGRHRNVVHLFEVLELIQESKSTMFLVLELVKGGELFDLISSNTARIPAVNRIPVGYTAAETSMRKFFCELASGIHYCHANHIAHRDLKPENLLVHNNEDGTCTLKIADFGLSAVFSDDPEVLNDSDTATMSSALSSPPILAKRATAMTQQQTPNHQSPMKQQMDKILTAGSAALGFFTCGAVDTVMDCNAADGTNLPTLPSPLKRMLSVVGSPHYVAPEIISQHDRRKKKESGNGNIGYDGTKADVWSAGVILYAMLFRSLPFGEDLMRCPRYQSFKKWYDDTKSSSSIRSRRRDLYAALNPVISDTDARDLLGPQWFFPTDSSPEARDLVIYMLNPDPDQRPSIPLVLQHPWLLKEA